MKTILISLGLWLFGAVAAQANQVDTCTTFADEPPSADDQLLCEKERQHAKEMGLPPSGNQTAFSLDQLYELKWSLHSMHRFKAANNNYVYRVYIEREE